MCGIVGFTGNRQAAPILLDGLSKLEYRGYDSAGLAVRDGENLAQVVKAKGRLSNLIEKTDGGKALKGTCGIGHTRWATHGEPSQTNAHPHVSGNCTRSGSGTVESEVVGVHNGIIENYTELKEKLLKHGYTFYSQTDTEVVIKLVDYYYKKYNLGPIDAIAKTMVRVRGSYALELMFRDYPGEIWVARKDTRQQVGTVERALQIFMKLGLVEPLDNGALYMSNIELFIGQSSTEGERKRRARMKISEQKRLSGQVSEAKADICPPEIEIKKEIDIEIEKERESEPGRAAPAAYGRYKNVILTDTELSELQAELPDKWEYYIDRLSGYIASTGRKYKNHAATIRRWVADDTAKAAPKRGIPDYSYKEGESL